MQINSIQQNNMSFSSTFVPTKTLKSTIDHAIVTGDGKLLKSIKSILNDGVGRKVTVENLFNGASYDMTTLSFSDRTSGYWAQSTGNLLGISNKINDAKKVINTFAERELKTDASIELYSKSKVAEELKAIKKQIFS